jgi:hypothetical protein
MATVRFSKEFTDSILGNAKKVFNKRIDEANKFVTDGWGDKLYDIIFAEFIPALNAVPPEFLRMEDNLRFDGFLVDDSNLSTPNLTLPFTVKRPMPVDGVPASVKTKAKKSSGYHNNEYRLLDIPEFAEFKQVVYEWQTRRRAISQQRDEFVASVAKVINAHATLAPALKMWPPLWDLVDDSYRDRHREIREVSDRKKEVAEVDLGSLTATVVAHKLTK